MKKTLISILVLTVLLLSACAVGPFTETMYVEEEPTAEPMPAAAPEFAVDDYYTPEEMEHALQFVEHYDGFAGFQIFLPEDWHYEIVELSEENTEFGLDFWPGGSGTGRLRLRCYDGSFGVCGTGLAESEGELPGTGKLRAGYYDGAEYPSFFGFYDSPGGWVLMNDMGGTWLAHEAELEKILSSLVLDPGVIRVSKAEELAREECDVYHNYLRTTFDHESGNILVEFVRTGTGGGTQASLSLEKAGEEYIVIKDE